MAHIEPNVAALALFGAACVACCFAFFTIVGMFPLRARPTTLAGVAGAGLVVFNLVLLIALSGALLVFASASLRWTSVVVLGGLVFLFTPSLFQVTPMQWRDSRGGLATLGAVQIAALVAVVAIHLPKS